MPSADAFLKLINAASGQGAATVDAEALRALLAALRSATVLLAAFSAAGLLLAARALRARRARKGAAAADPAAALAKLRKELDEMVRKTNERNDYINSVFSSIEDGIVLVDARGRVALYNPRARELLGLGPGVFFDSPRSAAAQPAEARAVIEACAESTRSRSPGRLRLSAADGRILDVGVSPITSKYRGSGAVEEGDGRDGMSRLGSLALVRDVTERMKLENMKKDFVATVSHEFRTPLTLISGFMEMFKTRDDIKSADRRRGFEIVEIETERLKRLVSELLTLSEIENSLPGRGGEVIDVADVLGKMAASLGKLAERKRQSLEVDVDVAGLFLAGNENWFYQAVKNLVENAIKYSPEGGSIRVLARREGDMLSVTVSDDGIGIAAAELDRIFERFYRVEKSRGSGGGGSGLGLALVKDIASIFGGTVEVRSEPGKGSVFTMRLPARTDGHGTN